MWFVFILGAIAFLIMEMPIVFWLLVLPFSIMLIIAFIGWLKK